MDTKFISKLTSTFFSFQGSDPFYPQYDDYVDDSWMQDFLYYFYDGSSYDEYYEYGDNSTFENENSDLMDPDDSELRQNQGSNQGVRKLHIFGYHLNSFY